MENDTLEIQEAVVQAGQRIRDNFIEEFIFQQFFERQNILARRGGNGISCFKNVSRHQNHLECLLKHRWLDLILRVSDPASVRSA